MLRVLCPGMNPYLGKMPRHEAHLCYNVHQTLTVGCGLKGALNLFFFSLPPPFSVVLMRANPKFRVKDFIERHNRERILNNHRRGSGLLLSGRGLLVYLSGPSSSRGEHTSKRWVPLFAFFLPTCSKYISTIKRVSLGGEEGWE